MVNGARKNLMSRRNHRERAQPLQRQRLGLLEKHKDYVHRARDYRSKKDRIKNLREKAAFRNKDEFYWGMVRARTERGVHVAERGNEALSTDVVKLLKTQDLGYIKVQLAQDEKKILKLRAQLEVTAPAAGAGEWDAASELAEVEKLAAMGVVVGPGAGGEGKGKGKGRGRGRAPAEGHVVFAEDRAAFDAYGSEQAAAEDADGEDEAAGDLGWLEPEAPARRRKAKAEAPAAKPDAGGGSGSGESDTEGDAMDDARTHRLALLGDLSALLGRVRVLRDVEARLDATKGLMGKGAARKVRGAGFVADASAPEDRNGERKRWEGKQWKWKLERRR